MDNSRDAQSSAQYHYSLAWFLSIGYDEESGDRFKKEKMYERNCNYSQENEKFFGKDFFHENTSEKCD